MKKTILVLVMLFLSLFLVSCGDKIEEKKTTEEIKENIKEDTKISTKQEEAEKINEEISDTTKDISEKLASGEITDKQAKEMMLDTLNKSKTVQSQLEIQKKQMPILFEIIKEHKKCLEDADDKSDMIECVEDSKKEAKDKGISEVFMDNEDDEEIKKMKWDKDEKQKTLLEIEKGIKEMEVMLPCLDKAKVMTDMMKCYEGNNR